MGIYEGKHPNCLASFWRVCTIGSALRNPFICSICSSVSFVSGFLWGFCIGGGKPALFEVDVSEEGEDVRGRRSGDEGAVEREYGVGAVGGGR